MGFAVEQALPDPDVTAGLRSRVVPVSYRVLMIAPTSFFADYGCHVRILEEARTLQRLGHRITICTYHNGRDLSELEILRTMRIPWRTAYEVGSSRHKIGFDLLLFVRCLTAMLRVRPDVIHAHLHEGALIGLVLARLFGVPLVFDLQGSLTGEMLDHRFVRRGTFAYRVFRWLERVVNRQVPRIITSSASAVQMLAGEFSRQGAQVTCVPDCVDTDVFAPLSEEERQAMRCSWGVPEDALVVVYLGKLAEYQGTPHLIRAAARACRRLPNLHFVIAGYPFVEEYRGMAAEMGIADRCTFTGRVPYEDAPRLLGMGDIAVSPKLSRTEGAGKLLNYMAVGLPVVAFDNAVSHEYLGAYGVYVPSEDVEGLADALADLAQDPLRQATFGGNLRRRAQEGYSWDRAGRTIVRVYDSFVDRDRAPEARPTN
jgi:glycosyltransferase involved in cell wall biosynthesis